MDKKIKKSLDFSIFEGAFYSLMSGLGDSYFLPLAVFLKATDFQLGLINSLPRFIGSLFQGASYKISSFFKGRKNFVVVTILLEALLYIPLIFIISYGDGNIIWIYLLIIILYFISALISVPAWSSWMAELVDIKIRGSYFSARNKIVQLTFFLSYMAGGIILQYSKIIYNSPVIAFTIMFFIAFVSGLFSAYFEAKVFEFKFKKERSDITFSRFLSEISRSNYGLLTLYLCLMNFAVYCPAAYFAPYVLNDLKFSYLEFVIVDVMQLVVKYLVFPIWGRLNDKYKSSSILAIAGFSMPLVPILWAFSRNFYELILIQIYAGITWAAFDLSSFNILLDTTNKSKREKYISYYNILNGFAILFGSLFGTVIVNNSFFWSNYIFVFMVSGLLRFSASIFFLDKLKALKTIEKLKFKQFFIEVTSIANEEFNRVFAKAKRL